MAAKDMTAARRTPIIAALPKMLFPALVILPGMIAVGLAFTHKDGYALPTVSISADVFPAAIKIVRDAKSDPTSPERGADIMERLLGHHVDKDKLTALE